MPWTLQKPAWPAAQPIDILGLTSLSRTLASQAADKLAFTIPVANADADPIFAYGDLVTLRKDATVWFLGKALDPKPTITGAGEEIAYEVAGIWWWLEQIVFQQSWKVKNPDTSPGQPPTITVLSSRVNLCQAADGTRLTSGQQIREALQFAIDCGAPFQIGNILDGVQAPIREARDLACAEVIRTMLRWSPDAVCWVDYSSAPLPTIHIQPRSALAAVTIPIDLNTGNAAAEFSQIFKRSDLKVPAVLLQYEQVNSADGSDWTSLSKDLYPPGAATNVPGAIIQTIELSGSKTTHQAQRVITKDLPADTDTDASLIAWFWERCAELQEFNQANLEVVASSFYTQLSPNQSTVDADGNPVTISDEAGNGVDYDAADLPRELTQGTITDWMMADHHTLKAAKLKVVIDLSYKDSALSSETDAKIKADAKALFHTDETDPALQNTCTFTVEVTATNAVSQIYSTISSDTGAEPIPVGLAQALWTALNTDQFEGSFRTVETEVGDAIPIGMGNALNVSHSRPEYATMRSLIQDVSEDLLMGSRSLRFGPAAHLSPQDFIELLRSNRRAVPSYRLSERTTGKSVSNSVANSVGWTPGTNTATQPPMGGGAAADLPWKPTVTSDGIAIGDGVLFSDINDVTSDISVDGLNTPIAGLSAGDLIWLEISVSGTPLVATSATVNYGENYWTPHTIYPNAAAQSLFIVPLAKATATGADQLCHTNLAMTLWAVGGYVCAVAQPWSGI